MSGTTGGALTEICGAEHLRPRWRMEVIEVMLRLHLKVPDVLEQVVQFSLNNGFNDLPASFGSILKQKVDQDQVHEDEPEGEPGSDSTVESSGITYTLFDNVMKSIVQANVNSTSDAMDGINETIISCISTMSKRTNVSISEQQKANSLKGRWWGFTRQIVADGTLQRNMIFRKRTKENGREIHCVFRILNVFQKSYNKWRIESSGPATKSSKIHCVRVVQDELRTQYFHIDTRCRLQQRFIALPGTGIIPFRSIETQGWN